MEVDLLVVKEVTKSLMGHQLVQAILALAFQFEKRGIFKFQEISQSLVLCASFDEFCGHVGEVDGATTLVINCLDLLFVENV